MERDLKNKVVVITGGAQGLGLSIAEKFLQKDVKVVIILDINSIKGVEIVSELNSKYGEDKSVFYECDVTKQLDTVSNKILENFQHVDVLVNNAGIVDESSLRKTIEVNTIAVIEWSVRFRDHMRIDKGGRGGTIINIASVYGFLVDPFLPYYKASKHATLGFTRSLGQKFNYEKTHVRVLALCPGFTHTAIINNKAWEEHQNEFEEFKKRQEWQDPDAVGVATVDIFENADSGSAWVIAGGKPIYQLSTLS